MNASSPDGTIVERPSPRANLLVFEMRANISPSDVQWLALIVGDALNAHDDVDMLLIMQSYDGLDLGARSSVDNGDVPSRPPSRIRRCAAAGTLNWTKSVIRLAESFRPLETKAFDLADEQTAWAWIEEN